MRGNPSFQQKSAAIFLSISLTLFNSLSFAADTIPIPNIKHPRPALTLSEIHVPKGVGNIQESFRGNRDKVVVLIQDAHAIPSAQQNIQKLIDYFQKEYGVELVALEGASADLDPQIFKSFPDKELLQKVFQEYQERGELTGGTAAAILNESESIYHGIENWDLFEKGLNFYLQAMEKESEILAKLEILERALREQKEKVYSKELLEIDRTLENFYENHASLLQVFQKLAAVKEPPKGSELALLFEESKRVNRDDSFGEMEVKKLGQKVQRFLKSRVTSEDDKRKFITFNEKFQEFQTSRITPQAFALFLKELAVEYHLPMRISKRLSHAVENQKRMEEIKGTKLFEDFVHYAKEVKESLFRNSEEGELDRQSERLRLFKQLARLELSRGDWNKIKALVNQDSFLLGNSTLLAAHLAFYQNAERRDTSFFQRLISLMRENEAKSALIVAGGFHTEGLTQRLKDQGFSYFLLAPHMDSVPKETNYRAHMEGDVSWKNYFETENGRVSLYSAFIRGVRDQLLRESKIERERILKSWRDQIILDLANQNRISQAGRYTSFIDELQKQNKTEKGDLKTKWVANVERFIQELESLEASRRPTQQNVLKLLKLATIPEKYVNPANLVPSATVSIGVSFLPTDLARSEVRSKAVASPSIGRMAVKGSTTAPSVTKETDAEREERFRRMSEYAKEEIIFKYGQLPDNHPATIYVRRLFNEALGQEAENYQVIVAPEWNEINAVALPDGTIIVSAGLLRFVQYREELKAVLAHEAIHIKKKHAEVVDKIIAGSEKKDFKNFMNLFLGVVGIKRMQEYEADLGWIIEEFDKRNINPLGQLTFFERLEALEKRYGGYRAKDLPHGGLEDRALNTESVFYFLDLAALSHELGEIPEDMRQQFPQMAQMERINFWLGVSSWIKGEERKNMQRKRLQIADEIPTKNLGMAIEAIYQLIKDEKDDAKKVINRKILTKLIERVDNELFPQSKWPDPKERGLARGLYYQLHVGLSYLAAEAIQVEELKRKQEEDNSFLQDIQDLEKLQEIMSSQAFQSLPVLHIAKSPLSFSGRVFKRFIEKEAINKKPTKKKIDDSIAFASDWSKSLSALYKQKGVAPMEASTIFTYVIASLYSAIPEKNKKLKDQARDKASQTGLVKKGFFEVEERTVPEEAKGKASQIGKEIFERTSLNKKFNLSDFQDIIERITNEVKNKSPEYVIDFFFEIWREDVPELPSAPGEVKDYKLAKLQDIKLKLKNYILFRLFEMSVNTFEQFRSLTEEAKRALILGGLHYFVYAYAYPGIGYILILEKNNQGVPLLVEYEAGHPSDMFVTKEVYLGETVGETDVVDVSMIDPEDRQYLNRILTSIEEVWMQPDRTRQDIVNLYQNLVEGKLGSELTEKGMKTVITEQIFTKILARYLAKFSKWGGFFKEIAALEKLGVPVSETIRGNRNEFGQMLSKLWLSLPEEPNRKELEQINKAVEFIEDPFLRVQLQSYYYVKLWPTLNFDERLDILFSKSSAGIFDLKRFHEFIEKEAKTEAQLRSALERLRKEFNLFMTTGSRELGLATIFSNFRADPKNAQDLIAALLQTWQSDAMLKQVLYQNIAEWSKLEERESPESDEEALMAINGMIQIAEKVENLIFRMDASAKYVLLRKLLTGDKGLVSVQNNRSSFLQALVTSTVSGENEVGLMAIIGEVIQALGGIKLWKPIYFSLQQLLVDRIAIPPKRLSKWMNILEHEVEADFEDKSVLKGLAGRGDLTLDQLSKRVKTFEKTPWRYESEFLTYSEEILRSKLTERGVVTPPIEKGQLTPLSFILEFAQNTGALGVRFLQLLPQFADLPEKYQDEFSKVYDSVYGQSKLTALAVLEREWPDFWKHVVSIEERVGGGSLMTVYKIKTTDGKEEVVKVLNPNLQFHLQNNIKVINELLDVLTKRYGPKYSLAKLVVEEVKEWIERDVRFENFLEKDRQFREDNDGFTQQSLTYKIYVPRSEGPENHYFMREEYIEGDNLTQWDKLQAEGHDLKDIISLLVKNYVEQLRRGFAHSDVHVGNFRVMKDKRVAILDRNFYLELKPEVKDLVNAVLNPFQLIALSPDEFIGKLVKISETNIPQDKREVLKQSWEWTKAEILKGDWKSISRFLVDLRKNGLKLPLEVTLVFKNINSLQQMSRRAGFNNLVEAYLYSGSGKRRAEVREASIAQFGVEKVNDIASKVALFLAPPEVRSELRDVQISAVNPQALINDLIQFDVKVETFAQALRDQTNQWLERIEKEKQGLVGLDVVKDRMDYWIGLVENLKDKKFNISVKISRQDDDLGIKNIAEALTKARDQIERVIISSQDGKVNHDLTATFKENDLFFTVLKSLERFNAATLTDQATLPVVSKTNAFDDLKANPALFGVGVTDTEGISDPLVEVAESTLQVVAALLRADKIREAKQLKNSEELKKIDAELLRDLFVGYSETEIIKFDGNNVYISRSELRRYLIDYMTKQALATAA